MNQSTTPFKERLLNFIGLSSITNRDVLMEDLATLDDETFEYMILSHQSDITVQLNAHMCEDCKAQHDGKCIAPGDDDNCPFTSVDWLSQPCCRDHLLKEAM